MKRESHPIDDFFRESLKDVKIVPSARSRERFLEESTRPGGHWGNGFKRWTNLFILGGVVTIAVVLFLLSRTTRNTDTLDPQKKSIQTESNIEEKSTPDLNNNTPNKAQENSNSITTIPTKAQSVNAITSYDPNSFKKPEKSNQNISSSQVISLETPPLQHQEDTMISNISFQDNSLLQEPIASARQEQIKKETESKTPESNNLLARNGSVPVLQDNPAKSDITPQEDQRRPASDLPKVNMGKNVEPVQKKSGNKLIFSPSLGYSIDWNLKQQENLLIHSLNFEGRLSKGNFWIYSGAGYAMTNGFHRYEVNYKDYLGEYKKLDSITFAWDQQQYFLLPSYHMSNTQVWDSALSRENYRIENRFSHLRIPLILGYSFYGRKWFSLSASTGVEMDFYLDSKQLSRDYDPGQKQVISINPVDDDLLQNKYYYRFNLAADFALSRRITLELEPQFRYLINPAKTASLKPEDLIIPMIRSSLKIKLF